RRPVAGAWAHGRARPAHLPDQGLQPFGSGGDARVGPTVSITDAMRKVVLARLGETLRIAGAADLVGEDLSIDTRRVGKLLADARADFPDAADWTNPVLWSGLRPATPTGQPIIGDSGVERLLLNVGQGALGFTLALGSAEMLAREITG